MSIITPLIILMLAFLNLVVLYYIIDVAVKSANADLTRSVRILINLKALELTKNGIDPKEALRPLQEINELKRKKSNGQLNQKEFDEKLKENLI
jgi:hypothetical protein